MDVFYSKITLCNRTPSPIQIYMKQFTPLSSYLSKFYNHTTFAQAKCCRVILYSSFFVALCPITSRSVLSSYISFKPVSAISSFCFTAFYHLSLEPFQQNHN